MDIRAALLLAGIFVILPCVPLNKAKMSIMYTIDAKNHTLHPSAELHSGYIAASALAISIIHVGLAMKFKTWEWTVQRMDWALATPLCFLSMSCSAKITSTDTAVLIIYQAATMIACAILCEMCAAKDAKHEMSISAFYGVLCFAMTWYVIVESANRANIDAANAAILSTQLVIYVAAIFSHVVMRVKKINTETTELVMASLCVFSRILLLILNTASSRQ